MLRITKYTTAIVFLLGCVLSSMFQQQDPFMASSLQLVASAAVVMTLIALALMLGRVKTNATSSTQKPPSADVIGGVAFVLGSAFMSLAIALEAIPAPLNVAGMIVLLAAGSALFWHWSQRWGWSEQHRLAVAGGLLLTYVWYGFVQTPSTNGTSPLVDTIGNVVFASGALGLLAIARKRVTADQGSS